jgi:hypothetical protein
LIVGFQLHTNLADRTPRSRKRTHSYPAVEHENGALHPHLIGPHASFDFTAAESCAFPTTRPRRFFLIKLPAALDITTRARERLKQGTFNDRSFCLWL